MLAVDEVPAIRVEAQHLEVPVVEVRAQCNSDVREVQQSQLRYREDVQLRYRAEAQVMPQDQLHYQEWKHARQVRAEQAS